MAKKIKTNDRFLELVALAIKDADRSIFNEDYLKQAQAVLTAVNKSGYEIVPRQPSEEFIKYVDDNLPFGRHKPSEWLAHLYVLMVANARRFAK
ncbi:MAG TPA: hypothetical protein VEB64_17795 [Azospirillaceae bacterium]|nr:hypothetical protein [Azospirillaceae bacterium]